ncbi:MAG: class I tRNA ligase family protein, partial [Patescibacteria group bacterium]
RNFTTKIWNIGRFILMNRTPGFSATPFSPTAKDKKNLVGLKKIKQRVAKHIEKFEFHLAAELLYHYVWHTFADEVVEAAKPRLTSNRLHVRANAHATLERIFLECLTMLHPFMPFVTEAMFQKFHHKGEPKKLLFIDRW